MLFFGCSIGLLNAHLTLVPFSYEKSKKVISFYFQNFSSPVDLSAYDGFELRLKGDGRRYKLIVRTSTDWDTVGYTASFDTIGGQWQSVCNTMTILYISIIKQITFSIQLVTSCFFTDSFAVLFTEACISSTDCI